MFNSSSLFRKIKKNQYAYVINRLSSSAYIVTYNEKKEIIGLSNRIIYLFLAINSCCNIPMIIGVRNDSFLFVYIYLALIFLLCLYFKNKLKKIINGRKKVPFPRETMFELYRKESRFMSWKEVIQHIFSTGILVLLIILCFFKSIQNGNKFFFLVACVLSILFLVATYISYLFVYHKIKYRYEQKSLCESTRSD